MYILCQIGPKMTVTTSRSWIKSVSYKPSIFLAANWLVRFRPTISLALFILAVLASLPSVYAELPAGMSYYVDKTLALLKRNGHSISNTGISFWLWGNWLYENDWSRRVLIAFLILITFTKCAYSQSLRVMIFQIFLKLQKYYAICEIETPILNLSTDLEQTFNCECLRAKAVGLDIIHGF